MKVSLLDLLPQHEPAFIRSKWNESELGELRLAVHEVSRQVSVLTALFHEKAVSAQPGIENLKVDMNISNTDINPSVGIIFNRLVLDIKTLTLTAKVYNDCAS